MQSDASRSASLGVKKTLGRLQPAEISCSESAERPNFKGLQRADNIFIGSRYYKRTVMHPNRKWKSEE